MAGRRDGGEGGALKRTARQDFWAGVMFMGLGAAFAVGATAYPVGSSAQPGPGFFPLGLGALMALLGLALVVKAWAFDAHARTDGSRLVTAWAWKPLLLIVGAVVVFGLALPRLGLVCTLPLVVVVSGLAGGDVRWRELVAMAALLTLGCWALFVWGLKLTLPLWPSLAFLRVAG